MSPEAFVRDWSRYDGGDGIMAEGLSSAYHFGMLIDLDRCNGCGACMVACMSENNIPFRADETDKQTGITWMRIHQLSNGEPFPHQDRCFLPMPCMHCAGKDIGHSPCVSVCPVSATDYDHNTGIISQIPSRCFGCRCCMVACPYHGANRHSYRSSGGGHFGQ